jgi:ABC-2 type transport system permease protein
MLHLLKIEWLKVKHYRAFWIFLALYLIGLFGINYIFYTFQSDIGKGMPLELFPFRYPSLYQMIGFISSWLLYFPGMLMLLLIGNEFTFKTHRQNVIDGLERTQFIVIKIIVAFILALIATLLCLLNVLIFGAMAGSSFQAAGAEYLVYTFIQSLSYILLAMVLGFLIRRSGLAIAIFFLYGLIFEQMIGGLIDSKLLHGSYVFYYMPLEASDALVRPPGFFDKMLRLYKDAPSTGTLIATCLVYIALYCLLTIRKFSKEDL